MLLSVFGQMSLWFLPDLYSKLKEWNDSLPFRFRPVKAEMFAPVSHNISANAMLPCTENEHQIFEVIISGPETI